VIASPSGDRVKNLVFDGAVDVLLLDLDTNEYRTEEQVRFFDDIRTSGVAVIVLTDDEARVTAVELMQKGAHSYCRKPPVLRELKGLIQRAGEHTVMRRKLESMRDPAPEHNPALEAAAPDKPWCDSLIGGSPSMRGVYDLVFRADYRRQRHRKRTHRPRHSQYGQPGESSFRRRLLRRDSRDLD
jgi:DNA-binding NtrC family response regulator